MSNFQTVILMINPQNPEYNRAIYCKVVDDEYIEHGYIPIDRGWKLLADLSAHTDNVRVKPDYDYKDTYLISATWDIS